MKIVRNIQQLNLIAVTCLFVFLATFSIVPAIAYDNMDIPRLKKLAEEGNADAQAKLGVVYASGIGVKLDKKEALKWYKKSAEQGDSLGQWNLAFMYVRGEEVEVDYVRARELFQKSAESGFENAQYDLGMMLLQGLGGKEDRTEAEKWFRKSAAKGYREAKKMLKELEPK